MEQIITGFVDKILVPAINGVVGVISAFLDGFFIPVVIPFLTNGGGFVIFGLLWVAFAYAVVTRQPNVEETWQAIRALPLIVQLVAWLLFLPVMAGLWVWETTWPLVMRIVVVAGLAGWNLLVFLPKWLTARP